MAMRWIQPLQTYVLTNRCLTQRFRKIKTRHRLFPRRDIRLCRRCTAKKHLKTPRKTLPGQLRLDERWGQILRPCKNSLCLSQQCFFFTFLSHCSSYSIAPLGASIHGASAGETELDRYTQITRVGEEGKGGMRIHRRWVRDSSSRPSSLSQSGDGGKMAALLWQGCWEAVVTSATASSAASDAAHGPTRTDSHTEAGVCLDNFIEHLLLL